MSEILFEIGRLWLPPSTLLLPSDELLLVIQDHLELNRAIDSFSENLIDSIYLGDLLAEKGIEPIDWLDQVEDCLRFNSFSF